MAVDDVGIAGGGGHGQIAGEGVEEPAVPRVLSVEVQDDLSTETGHAYMVTPPLGVGIEEIARRTG